MPRTNGQFKKQMLDYPGKLFAAEASRLTPRNRRHVVGDLEDLTQFPESAGPGKTQELTQKHHQIGATLTLVVWYGCSVSADLGDIASPCENSMSAGGMRQRMS